VGRSGTKIRGSRTPGADLPAATPAGAARRTHGAKAGSKAERKAAKKARKAAASRETAATPAASPDTAATPAGAPAGSASGTVVDAIIAAALGEAVAESLTGSIAESINDSFAELMAGGLANALQDALVDTVSAAVAHELPAALAAAAGTSLAGTPAPGTSRPGTVAVGGGQTATAAPRPARPARPVRAEPGTADERAVALAAARSLWETLSPRRLPVLPCLDLAVRRSAATDPTRVGGDWFDATAPTATSVELGVGDVTGHGPGAVALMAELCHATRAYALLDLPPGELMARLGDVLRAGGHQSLASACTARLDLPTGRLAWCNAGHPPPVLVSPAGDVRFLGDVHGPLLGAAGGGAPRPAGDGTPSGGDNRPHDGGPTGAETRYPQSTVTLPTGTTILLYAAGLVDQPDTPIAQRLDALATAASRAFGPGAAAGGGPGTRAQPPDAGAPPPLGPACDALLAELAAAGADGRPGEGRSRRDCDAILLAARLC
jgi:hypothetical protein